jgi:hypothetical protein
LNTYERDYTLGIKKDRLVFRSTSFRAERGSVLHSGIYNRELTSSLAAGGLVAALSVALFYAGVDSTPLHLAGYALLFVVLFVLLRVYVFYEEFLETVIDKGEKTLSVFRKGLPSEKSAVPLSELAGIRKGYTAIVPENPDGVRFVEKIALQHGTVIPGFGDVKEYHTVNLEFRDGDTLMVFSTEDDATAEEVLGIMRKFTGGERAPSD